VGGGPLVKGKRLNTKLTTMNLKVENKMNQEKVIDEDL
jgi:hypothetical protein